MYVEDRVSTESTLDARIEWQRNSSGQTGIGDVSVPSYRFSFILCYNSCRSFRMPIATNSGASLLDDGEIQKEGSRGKRSTGTQQTYSETAQTQSRYIMGPVAKVQLFTPTNLHNSDSRIQQDYCKDISVCTLVNTTITVHQPDVSHMGLQYYID